MKSNSTLASFKKRRSWLRIAENILRICIDGSNTTEIVYGSNIAFSRFSKYITFLLEKDMLCELNDERKVYRTTERGMRFLDLMNEIDGLLEESPLKTTIS